MKKVLGRCSLCGGSVTVPVIWYGIVPPDPTCESCNATAALGPVIPMSHGPKVQTVISTAVPKDEIWLTDREGNGVRAKVPPTGGEAK